LNYLPTTLAVAAFVLHVIGERRAAVLTGRPRDRRARTRAFTFYAGLATIMVALATPIDGLADKLFWVHMIQHLLLLTVAAPLIVLGHPWISIWRPFPLRFRRLVAQTIARSPYLAPLRGLCAALTRPYGAWLAFNVSLVAWHLPGPYDETLRNSGVHALEHASFLVFGISFWAQVIGAAPMQRALDYVVRIGYVAATMVVNVGLSIYLAFAQHPLYAHYAALAHRPGGITALADQQIGAGIMWTAGDMPFAIAIALLVQRWLALQDVKTTPAELLATRADADPLARGTPVELDRG